MTDTNPILNKNLEFIASYNPKLKEKLANITQLESDIELNETLLKEPNLSLNKQPLHSIKGAEIEAKEVFSTVKDSKINMTIILGIGIGHLFKEFCDYSSGIVILYEPNLEILRVALELVDFSAELSKKNVKVASTPEELAEAFASMYIFKSIVNFVYLDSYKKLYENEISSIFSLIESLKMDNALELNLVRNRGFEFIHSVLINFNNTLATVPLNEIKDLYKNKAALIVSAGPSLDNNIDLIKKNRNKFIIFCVGTAYKALAKEGIIPDFLNILEAFNCSGQVRNQDLTNTNLIIAPFVNKAFQEIEVKQKFLFPAHTAQGSIYWAKLTEVDISEYESGGTVSFEALQSARMLGFNKLILVGQDLAYLDNRCYSSNSNISSLGFEIDPATNLPVFKITDKEKLIQDLISTDGSISEEKAKEIAEIRLKAAEDGLAFVKGITGEMLPTHKGYAHFIKQFEEFAQQNPKLELINTSMKGAQINGFKNINLYNVLENMTNIERKQITTNFSFDKENILKNLKKELDSLILILSDFESAHGHIQKLEREIRRNRGISNEVIKHYKILLEIYDKLMVEQFEKNQMFKLITLTETLDLKYFADTANETGEKRIKNIFGLLKVYFKNNSERVSMLKNELENQIKLLNENIVKNK